MILLKIVRKIREKKWFLVDTLSVRFSRRHTVDLRRSFVFKHPYIIAGLSIAVVVGLSVVWRASRGRAQVAHFYAAGCLGDWVNPEYAQGRPESDLGMPINASTAALYDGGAKSIYCGEYLPSDWGFKGKIGRVSVSFSWSMEGLPHGVLSTGSATSTIPEITTESNSTPPSDSEEKTPTSWLWNLWPKVRAQEESAPLPPIVSESTPTPAVVEAPDLTEPQPAPDFPQANSNSINLDSAVVEDATPASDEPVVTEANSQGAGKDSAEINIQSGESATAAPTIIFSNTSSLPIVTPDGNLIEPIPTSTLLPLPEGVPDEHFLEISVSRAGGIWESVGKISPENWQTVVFELPINTWDELETMQIKIFGIATALDVAPSVLLDGLTVEVQYEETPLFSKNNIPIGLEISEPNFKKESLISVYASNEAAIVRTAIGELQQDVLWVFPNGADSWKIAALPGEVKKDAPVAIMARTIFWISADGASAQMFALDSDTRQSISLEVISPPSGWLEFSGGDWLVQYDKVKGFIFRAKGDDKYQGGENDLDAKQIFYKTVLQPLIEKAMYDSEPIISNSSTTILAPSSASASVDIPIQKNILSTFSLESSTVESAASSVEQE